MYRSHVTCKCQFLPSTVYTVHMLYVVPIWTGYIFTQVAALTPSVSDGLWHEAVASIPMSGTSSALSTSMSRSSSLMAPAHTLTHSLCHRGIYSCNHRCMYCGTCTWIWEASIKFALMIAPQNVLEPNPPPLCPTLFAQMEENTCIITVHCRVVTGLIPRRKIKELASAIFTHAYILASSHEYNCA